MKVYEISYKNYAHQRTKKTMQQMPYLEGRRKCDFSTNLCTIIRMGGINHTRYALDPILQVLKEKCSEGQLSSHYTVREGLIFYKGEIYVAT